MAAGPVRCAGGYRNNLDIDAVDARRAQLPRQHRRGTAESAAEVENVPALDVDPVDNLEHLRRAAGRQEALAVERLHAGQNGVAVLALVSHLSSPSDVPGAGLYGAEKSIAVTLAPLSAKVRRSRPEAVSQ